MITIRKLNPKADLLALRACTLKLHDSSRRYDPTLPPGSEVIEPYLCRLLELCESSQGAFLLARHHGRIVGYVCVLAHVQPEASGEPYAFISDLFVEPSFRRRGIGRKLLARAEAFARAHGAKTVRLQVLAGNTRARRFCASLGYHDRFIEQSKSLTCVRSEVKR